MKLSAIKRKAHALFDEACFLAHIHNQDEYEQALEVMDALMDDYDNNVPLIEMLSVSIERWEDTAEEFSEFNNRIRKSQDDIAVLKLLMEQHNLGVSDLPEIGSKSLVSKIMHAERQLTKEHIMALSKRFKVSPALFFKW